MFLVDGDDFRFPFCGVGSSRWIMQAHRKLLYGVITFWSYGFTCLVSISIGGKKKVEYFCVGWVEQTALENEPPSIYYYRIVDPGRVLRWANILRGVLAVWRSGGGKKRTTKLPTG